MAIQFPKIFSTTNARTRILILVGVVAAVGIGAYVLFRYLGGPAVTSTGPSRVAAAPPGLQSVPGGKLSPEYYRALTEANKQAAQQAQITGGSAVPTLINPGSQQGNASFPGQSCVMC